MMKKEKIRKIKTGSMIAALVTAFSVFGCMLYVEKKTLEDYEKKTVLVTSRQTEAGEEAMSAPHPKEKLYILLDRPAETGDILRTCQKG